MEYAKAHGANVFKVFSYSERKGRSVTIFLNDLGLFCSGSRSGGGGGLDIVLVHNCYHHCHQHRHPYWQITVEGNISNCYGLSLSVALTPRANYTD
jgi:hypothetical protein